MNNKTVFFRADMNSVIATGHMMRCLSIADAVTSLGGHCVFISADQTPAELVNSRGYELISLASDWQKIEDELDLLSEIIREKNPLAVVVDSYQVTYDYLKAVNKLVNTYYVDDLNNFDYPVHGIICYAIYAEDFEYNQKDKMILGPKYAPLRKEFAGCEKKKISDTIHNILVMSGGTDQFGMIDKIVSKLESLDEKYVIRAICGRLNTDLNMLLSKYEGHDRIQIIPSVEYMKAQLEWADVVVTAGGSTLYEISAVGVSAITFSFADNQLGNVKGFEKQGIMPYAGDARYDDVASNVIKKIDELKPLSARQKLSIREQELVDGNGAIRIANVLLGKENET